MGNNAYTILIGEDEPEVSAYLLTALECMGHTCELARDGDELLRRFRESRDSVGVVLLDIMMPRRDGIEVLTEIRRVSPNLPVIVISGSSSTGSVVKAMKSGATDFLPKPVSHDELRKAIARAVEARPADARPASRQSDTGSLEVFLGLNPRMREIRSLLDQIGHSDAPVLIRGETGSGKEVLARELHACSPRAGKPFLKLNCAALPSELVESELFGYERGAFTGAFQRKAGMFELANGGTILLDEIGDMGFTLQAKLLHILQDHRFQRIGGKEVVQLDVRVMAATHRDLETAIIEQEFREDLFYRLNVISIHLPALRERPEDIIPLAEFLYRKHTHTSGPAAQITPELREAMLDYHWPGNVRELENWVQKLVILRDPALVMNELRSRATRIAAAAAPRQEEARTAAPAQSAQPILEQVTQAKHQAETVAILNALNSTRWNRKAAAAILQIDYKALLYKMKKLGIEGKVAAKSPAESPSDNEAPVVERQAVMSAAGS